MMMRKLVSLAILSMLCLSVSPISAQERGKSGGKSNVGRSGGGSTSNAKPPGGNWSDSKQQPEHSHQDSAAMAAGKKDSQQKPGGDDAAAGAAAANRKSPQASNKEDAVAGAAVSNRNTPQNSGAEGAAAGAAMANRNAPKTSAAEGAAAGAAAANRNAPEATGAQGAAAGYAAVRNSFTHQGIYGQDWHDAHPGTWTGAGWAAGTAWTSTSWNTIANHCGYNNATPVYFNYGSNVTCINGNVALNGQNLGTAEEFSQQASDLAQSGTSAVVTATEKWLPLGVFAMVQNDQQHPHLIMQIAVNQHGDLRGNYTDNATDNTLPIHGAVDAETQRAAWTVGGNTATVIEAGLSNLTQGHAPALLHKNGNTERWMLVRLDQPE